MGKERDRETDDGGWTPDLPPLGPTRALAIAFARGHASTVARLARRQR